MMVINMVYKMGSWVIICPSDPRWNCSGKGVGGFGSLPSEAEEKIAELTDLYGEPPADARITFIKD